MFERKFDFVPVTYDDIFVELVTQWQETAGEIAPFADRLGAGQVARVAGWLADADSTQDSIAAHAIDVLLYRGFSLVADAVRDRVLKVITEHLTADSDWVVIAHSLGTAVAHDALDKLWRNSFGQGEPLTGNPIFRQAKAVVMIANLSRLLQSDREVLTGSWVQPGHLGQPGRMGLRYLNINHRLDPLTRAHPFDPTDWPDRSDLRHGCLPADRRASSARPERARHAALSAQSARRISRSSVRSISIGRSAGTTELAALDRLRCHPAGAVALSALARSQPRGAGAAAIGRFRGAPRHLATPAGACLMTPPAA